MCGCPYPAAWAAPATGTELVVRLDHAGGSLASGTPPAASRARKEAPAAAISVARTWVDSPVGDVMTAVAVTVRSPGCVAAITRCSAPVRNPALSRGIARLASTEANTSNPKATLAAPPVPVSVTQAARSRNHSVLIRPPPATAPLGRVCAGPTGQRRRPARPR